MAITISVIVKVTPGASADEQQIKLYIEKSEPNGSLMGRFAGSFMYKLNKYMIDNYTTQDGISFLEKTLKIKAFSCLTIAIDEILAEWNEYITSFVFTDIDGVEKRLK
jgi:hypothetical protein